MEGDVLLLSEADTRLCPAIGPVENAVKVAIIFVVPSNILKVRITPAFNVFGHFLEARKRIPRRGRSGFQPPLNGEAQAPDLGQYFEPRQQEPTGGEHDPEGETSPQQPACEKRGYDDAKRSEPKEHGILKGAQGRAKDGRSKNQEQIGDDQGSKAFSSMNLSSCATSKSGRTKPPKVSSVGVND